MKPAFSPRCVAVMFVLACAAFAQSQTPDDPNARPPVTKIDLEIVQRAQKVLDSPTKWNRSDNRVCPADAKTFSLYCALEKATIEAGRSFVHRGAPLQEMRFVIDEIAGDRNYDHRLMDYNNDPQTTFADVQQVFRIVENLIALRLRVVTTTATRANDNAVARPTINKTEVEIARRARSILDSPLKWDRKDTQDCPANARIFSLYCALVKGANDITGTFDNSGAAIQEARRLIDETAPNHKSYGSRLKDYNNDPTVTFQDLQHLLLLLEERLSKP